MNAYTYTTKTQKNSHRNTEKALNALFCVSVVCSIFMVVFCASVVWAGERLYPGTPIPNGADCPAGQYPLGIDGSGNAVGCAVESDPQVGTLTNTKWCTTDGSAIDCTSNAPVAAESDPTLTNDGAVTLGNNLSTVTATFDADTSNGTLAWDGANSQFELMGGNVGIGTTNPTVKLDVSAGDVRFTGNDILVSITNSVASRDWQLRNRNSPSGQFTIRDQTANADRLSIDTSGNVGIGTTGPDYLLHVSDSAETNGIGIGTTGITFIGTAQPKRTIVLTAAGAIAGPNSTFADQVRTDGTNFSYYTLNYDAGADEKAFWQFVVPDSYTGTTAEVTLYWMYSGGNCSGGLCEAVWNVEMDGKAATATFDAALQAVAPNTATGGNAGVLNATSAITATTGWAPGEVAIVKISRDADNVADDLAVDAKLVQVKIEWTASAESD